MKTIVERLTEEVAERYLLYIEQVTVDIRGRDEEIELRCGFALRSDHQLRTLVFKMPAADLANDASREAIITVVFQQLELMIDQAIADVTPNN